MSAKASIPAGALAQNLLATADQTATASDAPPQPPPAPMESDEEQDDESLPEVPGTTI